MKQLRKIKALVNTSKTTLALSREYQKMLRGLCPRCTAFLMRNAGNLADTATLGAGLCDRCREMVLRRTARMDELCSGKLKAVVKQMKKDKVR